MQTGKPAKPLKGMYAVQCTKGMSHYLTIIITMNAEKDTIYITALFVIKIDSYQEDVAKGDT